MTEMNPYESGATPNSTSADREPQEVSTGQAAYNVVTDVFTGVNVRKRDNIFQLAFISISVCLFAGSGAAVAMLYGEGDLPWYGGAMIGAFAGLVIGFFASGIYLMIYRAIMHLKGKHG